jgi:hypothetical protein
MPSPFPGMDPYLENPSIWPAFHHTLINTLRAHLLPGLQDRYKASIGERLYAADSRFSSVQREEYIAIRERKDGKLVTLVDVVNPSNKTTALGRSAYLNSRREARKSNSNIVEIDLVMQGQSALNYSREGLPDWNYAVTVTRATTPERYEIYTSTLEKRLPRFRLPLAADDRDTVVDLQAVFTSAFEGENFDTTIDYRCEPDVPLTAEEYHRLAARLKWPSFTHEEIAPVAYQIWNEEGCLHGRDREHWKLAMERLRKGREQ